MPDLISGIDISNLQGLPAVYRSQQWYRDAAFLIVQAIPRPRPAGIIDAQLRAGRDDGKHLGLYSWLWHDPTWRLNPDVRQDQLARLATVPDDVPLHMRPWLDVEDNQSTGWRVSIQQRKNDVLAALATLTEWAAARGLPQAGVYTSRFYITLLFGGDLSWLPAGTVLWLAHYGVAAGSLISGACVAHQFSSTPIDCDVMLPSEIISTTEAPTVRIPADYVTKFSLTDDQDVQGLIDNFEGVLRSVRDQDLAAASDVATSEAAGDVSMQAKIDQIKAILQ